MALNYKANVPADWRRPMPKATGKSAKPSMPTITPSKKSGAGKGKKP